LWPSFAPSDLVVASDGSLYVVGEAANGVVYHLSSTGTVLNSFQTPDALLDAIAFSADGTSLWLSGDSTSILNYSLTGVELGSFPIVNPDDEGFITVVPDSIPEPGSICLFALATFATLSRRRKNRKQITVS
jgi:hypothetical protein